MLKLRAPSHFSLSRLIKGLNPSWGVVIFHQFTSRSRSSRQAFCSALQTLLCCLLCCSSNGMWTLLLYWCFYIVTSSESMCLVQQRLFLCVKMCGRHLLLCVRPSFSHFRTLRPTCENVFNFSICTCCYPLATPSLS